MSTETKAPAVAAPVTESLDDQLKRVQLENALLEKKAKELELREREYHIKDLQGRLAERDLQEQQLKQSREAQGRTFAQDEATDQYRWKVCTHRKGGIVSVRDMRALTQGGNEEQYAVIKHQMINGDIWVRCQRCGKTWSPPVESNFFFNEKGKQVAPVDGVFDNQRFLKAQDEYLRATQFPTRNTMSGSVQCRFLKLNPETGRLEDAADLYRESVKDTNLR